MSIIDELLANPDVSSSDISSKYRIPLSTIQRRRSALESMSLIEHKYQVNPIHFGFRTIEFWVMVEKGKALELGQQIFQKYQNVLHVSLQINSVSNIRVIGYVNTSEQLYRMIEEIKSLQFVNNVESAETVKEVGTRQVNFLRMLAKNDSEKIPTDGLPNPLL